MTPIEKNDISNTLMPATKSRSQAKRKGCGNGSGNGKTAGRGQKGQKSRSGGGVRPGFEGGQMPLQRRIPKRGFVNIHKLKYNIINIQDLKGINITGRIGREEFEKSGIIRNRSNPVKVLGDGEIDYAVSIAVDMISKTAREKIEKAGGTVHILEKMKPIIKGIKKEIVNKKTRKTKKASKQNDK